MKPSKFPMLGGVVLVLIFHECRCQGHVLDGHGRPATKDDLPPTLVPTPPVVFTVGVKTTLPTNYSIQFSEQLDIRLNANGTTDFHKDVSQGVRNQNLSQPLNSFRMTLSVIASPYFSAPINGSNNKDGLFKRALEDRAKIFRDGPQHPFVSQVDVLFQLFNQLNELQRQQKEIDAKNEKNANYGSGQQGDSNGAGIGGGHQTNSDLATPNVVLMVQRFSVPEPNTSEAGMLDSAFNFGQQANRFTFGDLDLFTDEWKDMGGQPAIPFDLSGLGNSVQEAQTVFNLRIRNYVKALREATASAYKPVEEMSYGGFRQHQYFIKPAGTCQLPVDPHGYGGPRSQMEGVGRFTAGCFSAVCRNRN